MPCGLGGTGLPLLQGSHLGIPGGELLLECEHLLLQCLCSICPYRRPRSLGWLRVVMLLVSVACPDTLEVSL